MHYQRNLPTPNIITNDEEIEELYEKVTHALENCKGNIAFVIGDFNAKVGAKENDREKEIGAFGLGNRNQRGEMLIEFAAQNKLKVMNTFFKKSSSRKWTWQGPNNSVKNEIDYILSSRPDVVKDVNVITRANMGSDHRPVFAKVKINTRRETSENDTKEEGR